MVLNPQETKDLVTFTEEILNRKLHFLDSVSFIIAVAFSYVSSTYPSVNDLIFTQNFLKAILKSAPDLPLPSESSI